MKPEVIFIIFLIGVIIYILFVIFAWAMCKSAALADKWMDEIHKKELEKKNEESMIK